jgi:hypothetical protein
MKNKLLLLVLCCLPVLAQQKFTPDALGRVTDPAFRKLIKERGYTLVCSYDTLSLHPLQVCAPVLKEGKWLFMDLLGREVEPLPNLKQLTNRKTPGDGYKGIRKDFKGVDIVSFDNKQGVNLYGKVLLPPEFDNVFAYPRGIIAILNYKFSLYNYKGKLLTTTKYDCLKWYGPFLKAYKGDVFCLLNSQTGMPLNSEWYSDEKNFLNTLAAAKIDDAYIDYTVMLVNNGTHYFLLDENGAQLGDKYEYIAEVSGQYYMGYNGADCWLIDEKGNRVAKSVKYPGETSMLIDDKGKSLGHLYGVNMIAAVFLLRRKLTGTTTILTAGWRNLISRPMMR